jgi:hypothetical protein
MRCPHTVDNPTPSVPRSARCRSSGRARLMPAVQGADVLKTAIDPAAATGRTVQSITRLSLKSILKEGFVFERQTPLIDRSKQDLSHTFVCERQGRQTNPLRLFCGRVCTRPAGQTLSVGALREVKRLHQGRAEIPLYKLVFDAATQEIRP